MQEQRQQAIARMNSLVGQHQDEAIKTLGPPTSSAKLASGGSVLEWMRSQQQSGGGGSYTTFTPTLVKGQWVNVPQQQAQPVWSQTVSCRILMNVGANQLVESWRAEGNGC